MTRKMRVATLVALVATAAQLISCDKGDDGKGKNQSATNFFELTGKSYTITGAFADEFPTSDLAVMNYSLFFYGGTLTYPIPTPASGKGPLMSAGIAVATTKADAGDISGTYTTTTFCDGYASKDNINNSNSSNRTEFLSATITLTKIQGSTDNYELKATYTEDGKSAKANYKGKMVIRR